MRNSKVNRPGTQRPLTWSKCVYDNLWVPCHFCQERNIETPCIKLPGPKTAKQLAVGRLLPTAIDAKIKGQDVLLLHSIYAEERGSLLARSLIRQFSIAYGESINCHTLRHAVLAYAAVLLPPSQFRECSDRHASEATRRLIRTLSAPETITETHVFAAGMLMWRFWVRNRKKDALIHAKGVMTMLSILWEKGGHQSAMLKVFGPLAYSDASFYVSMSEQSKEMDTAHRTTFEQRVKYHHQMIQSGGPAIVWTSATVQAMADVLWDIQRVMLELLLETARGDTNGYDENDSRVQYLWSEYNDADLQQAVAALEWDGQAEPRSRTVETEVKIYLLHQLLCIRLLMTLLRAPTILEGLSSQQVREIAEEQLLRGSSHRLLRAGEAFEVYTWAFVLNLGAAGLAFSPERTPEGNNSHVTEGLIHGRLLVGIGRTPEKTQTQVRSGFESILGKPKHNFRNVCDRIGECRIEL